MTACFSLRSLPNPLAEEDCDCGVSIRFIESAVTRRPDLKSIQRHNQSDSEQQAPNRPWPVRRTAWLMTAAAVALSALPVLAQDDAASDPLSGVRVQRNFGPSQGQAVDSWIAAQIRKLKQGVSSDAVEAAKQLRQSIRQEMNNPASTPQYISHLAERMGAAAVAEYGAGEGPEDLEVDRAIARVLKDLNRVPVRDGLVAGLKHPASEVRYLSARTFAELRGAISDDAATTRSVITVLKAAGVDESNGTALAAIYQALSYTQDRHRVEALTALVDVLAAQVTRRKDGQQVIATRAELTAFTFIRRVRDALTNQQLNATLVQQLAATLALDVGRFSSAMPAEKINLEERIEECESLLDDLTSPLSGGSVRKEMKKREAGTEESMSLELIKWVGAEGQAGALNSSPWSVPVGGL